MTAKECVTLITFAIPSLSVLIIVIIGIKKASWLKIQGITNDLLREQNAELRSSHADLQSKYNESLRAIATLQGKVAVLEAIPLQAIAETLKNHLGALREVASTNARIVQLMQNGAVKAETVRTDLAAQNAHAPGATP